MVKEHEPDVWTHLKPISFPFTAFSEHKLEKFVAQNRHKAFENQDLVMLGDKLRLAQRAQLVTIAIAVLVMLGPALFFSFQEIGR